MGKAIQFRGREAVVDAYKLNGVGPWAVWCQSNILCSSSDIDIEDIETGGGELDTFLEMMESHGSTAIYELKVYKVQGEDITSKTAVYRGFGFSLVKAEERGLIPGDGQNGVYTLLKSMDDRMKAMELRLAEAEAEEELEPPADDGTMMGKIGSMAMGLLESPQIQQAIAVGAINLFKKIGGGFMNTTVAGAEAGSQEGRKVAGVQTGYVNLLDQAQIDKVHAAITRLSAKDALLGDHLTALADIAENDPNTYKMALKML